MPRVVHFEIPADNPERAIKFYSSVFGWKIEKTPMPMDYWLVTTGDKDQMGINGAIMPRGKEKGVINTIGVSSVDEFIEKIKANKGKILQPRMPIPGVGYFAYFQDTEGNKSGILEPDMSAK
jgi:uncharacterized protein